MNIEKFKSFKTVKREIAIHGEILQDNEDEIMKFINFHHSDMSVRKVLLNMYHHIALVGIYAKKDEIWQALTNKLNSRGHKGGSLNHFIHIYGETCGKVMFDRFSEGISKRNKIKSTKKHRMTLFGSEKEYYEWARSVTQKQVATKKRNGKFGREYSNLCVEYYHRLGIYDKTEIDNLITIAKSKSWVYSYSKEDKREVIDKTMKTKKQNYENGIFPNSSAGYSKKANNFFRKVIDFLPEEICDNVITLETCDREYWVRDKTDKMKYYFVDFCIPNLLAVEYNGNAYHPKHELDENYIAYKMGALSTKDKYLYDKRKNESIEYAGMKLLHVWDDSEDVEFVVNWIMENYYERTKSLDR